MNIDGSWWVLIGPETFDRQSTARIESKDGALTWSDGTTGSAMMREGKLWLSRTLPGATPAQDVHERYQILKELDDGDVREGRLYTPTGDLSAYHEGGLLADMTSFRLVRDGSLTLEQIEAQREKDREPLMPGELGKPINAFSTAPGEKLHGKWVVLVDDEDFDRGHNLVVELDGNVVRSRYGEGSVEREGDALLVSTSPDERLVLDWVSPDGNSLSGMIYHGTDPLPPGNPSKLWPADDAPLDDAAYADLPISDPVTLIRDEIADEVFAHRSRFGDIDISMYSSWRVQASGFYSAQTDDEIEAALRHLPSAKVQIREPA